jgi:phospholipid/cholesterol/gamma-HCH transport system permease protein
MPKIFSRIDRFFSEIGSAVLFVGVLVDAIRSERVSRTEIFRQIWQVTLQSSPTTAMAGFFVGAIMSVQFTLQMQSFGALGFLGGLSTSATVREVGPLLIAFLLAGKIGAFTSAELGTMRVTEQIDAVRCLGADPIAELVVPRFLGIVVASFFLLGLGLVGSVCGGALLAQVYSGVSIEEYFRHIPQIVHWFSIVSGLFKCFIFSLVLATICTYRGYTATGGAKGVGLAVVKTSVSTMVCIVVADWGTSLFMNALARVGGFL